MSTLLRRLVDAARRNPLRLALALGALGAYGLAFVPPYSSTDLGVVVLSAAPVLVASWLLGFWGGLAAALLTFPLNAYLLTLTGVDGWMLLMRPATLQGSILVLILGIVVGGLRDIAWQLRREHDAREATEAAVREADVRYRLLAESATDGILTMDRRRRIRYANPAAARIFGLPIARLVGRTFDSLLDEDGAGGRAAVVARLAAYLEARSASTAPQPIDLPARRADDSRMELEASFGLMHEEGAPVFTGIVRNVTERRELERALRAARNEAVQANQAKSEFISRMSHELRTPLNAILGFAQLVDVGALDAEDRDSIGQIRNAGRHLLTLVDEVLDIARIEAGRIPLSPEPIRMADAVAEAWDLVRPRAMERRVTLSADGLDTCPPARADAQRLRQVLLNLLSNGVKYNREGGRLSVEWTAQPDGALRIALSDEGPGIGPEHVSRLFTPFDRLGAERSGIEGTGVGLSLSRTLVHAMGGAMGYEPGAGGGARFWFTLPPAEGVIAAAAVGARSPAPAPAPPAASRRDRSRGLSAAAGAAPADARALCIVPDPVQQRLLERLLDGHGLRATCATQAGPGLELAARHRPVAVVVGSDLPDMDCLDVVRALRLGPTADGIPVLVLAQAPEPAMARALREAGATEVLELPLDITRFMTLLPPMPALAPARETA